MGEETGYILGVCNCIAEIERKLKCLYDQGTGSREECLVGLFDYGKSFLSLSLIFCFCKVRDLSWMIIKLPFSLKKSHYFVIHTYFK